VGLNSLLSIARSALLTQQKSIDTSGHNIANASTEGYSRQRLLLTPEVPLQTAIGQLGRGVTASGIQRVRDQFLDATFRRENGDLGRYQSNQDLLTQVQGVFGEPSDTGIAAGLDQLFSAFGDLANDPTGKTPRALVQQAGLALTQQFQTADRRINEIAADVVTRIRSGVESINATAQQIAQLNVEIRGEAGSLREAPDLKDQRDKLVDSLSNQVGVRVIDRGDGTIAVAAGEALLVDGGQATALELRDQGNGSFGVGMSGVQGTINLQSGSMASLVELSSTTIPGVRNQLDRLAAGIVTEVNRIHAGGRTLTGVTGVPFFDPAGTTAASFSLSAQVTQSTDNIAAGQSGGAGDNAAALAISQLRTAGVATFGGSTLGQTYQQLVADLGGKLSAATQSATAQDTVASQADAQRKSVSGVSIDEEMTNVVAQQNAFAAAARLVNVADQMMQAVIAMVQ
jgi:flagellar hook-associated protein 1 FlgK